MKSSIEKFEQFDEIVFKDRNKNYGAFSLRKNYKRHLIISIIISASVFLTSASIPLVASYLNCAKILTKIDDKTRIITTFKPPVNDAVVMPPSPPSSLDKLVKECANGSFRVTDDTVSSEPVFIGLTFTGVSDTGIFDTTAIMSIKWSKAIEQVDTHVHIGVEEIPEFPGGEEARTKFLKKNIIYPEREKSYDIQGQVVVGFVVEKDGTFTNINIIKSVSPGIDEEAIRVVKIMPPWNPGKQNGNIVRCQMSIPIRFVLN